jgi:4-carboxymuconolactone decarboxylase
MSSEPEERRAAGRAKMEEVYGFAMDPATTPGRYGELLVDHLFGEVWTDPTLDLRDRRLLIIGAIAAQDKPEVLELQFDNALRRGELTTAQLREVVVHLTQYVGWPISTSIYATAEKVIARRAAAAGGAGGTEGGAGSTEGDGADRGGGGGAP